MAQPIYNRGIVYQEIHALNDRARQLARKNLPEAIRLTEEAARLSQDAGAYGSPYAQGLAESWHQLGGFYLQLARYDQALSYFGRAQLQYESLGGGEPLASLFSNIGTAYTFMADYADALRYELKGLEEAQRAGQRKQEATSLNNVGCILTDTGDYTKALSYLEQALPIFDDLKDADGQAMVLDSLALAFLGLQDFDQALTNGLESVRLCQIEGDRRREAEHLNTVGRIYAAQKVAEQAQQYFAAALELARAGDYRREEEMALRHLGGLYHQFQKQNEARTNLLAALKIATDLGARRNQYECHETLSAVYRELGDFENALYHYQQFHTIKETVFNERTDMRLRGLSIQHQLEAAQKESEIYQLRNVELEREIAERKRAESALKELAVTDGLTGLANRRHLLDLARAALALSQRYTRPLSVLMMDVDRFKAINDTHGHAVGDQVLMQFASRLKTMLRMADMVGRYGGDEFIAILPETDLSQAMQVAHRVRTAITEMPIQVKDFGLYIHASIGISSNEHDYNLSLEMLIEHADAALYAVKSGQHGQIYAFEPSR